MVFVELPIFIRCAQELFSDDDLLDILPALKDGDSFCKTAMSRRENVLGSVHVAVVYRAAIAATHSLIPSPALPFGLLAGMAPQHEQVWVV